MWNLWTTSIVVWKQRHSFMHTTSLIQNKSGCENMKEGCFHISWFRSFPRQIFEAIVVLVLRTKNTETKRHKRETEKTALANRTNYTLVWSAFYDLQPRNEAGPILIAKQSQWCYGNLFVLRKQNIKQTIHGLWGSAGLKCLSTFLVGDFEPKLGQTNLVFGERSGFISRSVHARLQVSVCSSYGMSHPG